MIAPRLVVGLAALLLGAAGPATENPWFGTWKLRIVPGEKPETLVYRDAGNGAMRMESVEERSVLVTWFDGEPAVDVGAGATGGRSLAIKATSPTSYTWTFSTGGKPRVRGINTLAADRRTFTEVSWLIDEPGRKITHVYERQ